MNHGLPLFFLGLLVLGPSAAAQDRFATSIVSYHQGGGGGLFDPTALLGGPLGAGFSSGSLDVLTLGSGGDVTVGFDVTITDGPGADFIVYENPFVAGGSIFAEYAFVEVSTNGTDFARFPHAPLPSNPTWGSAPGLAGGTPCLANVATNTIDPFDPMQSGGDAFDLAELALDPLVLGGLVDLAQIHFVRLVNASATGADIDAIAVIQHAGNQAAGAPTCDLWRDAAGFVHLRVADPDGLADLDAQGLRVSINLVPVPAFRLRAFMTLVASGPNEVHFVSSQPIANFGFKLLLGASVADQAGHFSGDQLSLQP